MSGRGGEWESQRVGEAESGRAGEWESRRVGEPESGRAGEWEKKLNSNEIRYIILFLRCKSSIKID